MTPRLFLNIYTMELRKLMSYRVNFWVNTILGFVLQLGLAYFVWEAVYRESGQTVIGGYTFPQMATYYVLVLLLGKIVRGAEFGSGGVSDEIYTGGLTRYLIYPTRFFLFKYAQHLGLITIAVIQLLVFGSACYFIMGLQQHVQITATSVAMMCVTVLFANFLHFLIFWPVESVAFWQDNVWSLTVMFRFAMGMLGGSVLPLELFPSWMQNLLIVLPFKYLFAFPVHVLMGRVTTAEWLVGLAICGAWCGIVAAAAGVIWRRGIRQYTGVGI